MKIEELQYLPQPLWPINIERSKTIHKTVGREESKETKEMVSVKMRNEDIVDFC